MARRARRREKDQREGSQELLRLLRLDPWTAPFEAMGNGEGWQHDEDDVPASSVDPLVEASPPEWRPLPGEGEAQAIAFVDGVRRIESGLSAWSDRGPVWALLGACAAGAVICRSGRAEVTCERQDRLLVVGLEEFPAGRLEVQAGHALLHYRTLAAGGREQERVHFALLAAMRSLEEAVAEDIPLPPGGVLVLDGLISFLPQKLLHKAPVLGLIKEHRALYLERFPWALSCLAALDVGERTPLFRLETTPPRLPRLSWYVRVAPRTAATHALSGVIRLETWAQVGIDEARRLASLSAAVLPRFAPPALWHRRAPVNLYPVAALEERLRRSLGDATYVRRHIAEALAGPQPSPGGW